MKIRKSDWPQPWTLNPELTSQDGDSDSLAEMNCAGAIKVYVDVYPPSRPRNSTDTVRICIRDLDTVDLSKSIFNEEGVYQLRIREEDDYTDKDSFLNTFPWTTFNITVVGEARLDVRPQEDALAPEGSEVTIDLEAVNLAGTEMLTAKIVVPEEHANDISLSAETVSLTVHTSTLSVNVGVREDGTPEPRENVALTVNTQGVEGMAARTVTLTIPRHGYKVQQVRVKPGKAPAGSTVTVEVTLNGDAPVDAALRVRWVSEENADTADGQALQLWIAAGERTARTTLPSLAPGSYIVSVSSATFTRNELEDQPILLSASTAQLKALSSSVFVLVEGVVPAVLKEGGSGRLNVKVVNRTADAQNIALTASSSWLSRIIFDGGALVMLSVPAGENSSVTHSFDFMLMDDSVPNRRQTVPLRVEVRDRLRLQGEDTAYMTVVRDDYAITGVGILQADRPMLLGTTVSVAVHANALLPSKTDLMLRLTREADGETVSLPVMTFPAEQMQEYFRFRVNRPGTWTASVAQARFINIEVGPPIDQTVLNLPEDTQARFGVLPVVLNAALDREIAPEGGEAYLNVQVRNLKSPLELTVTLDAVSLTGDASLVGDAVVILTEDIPWGRVRVDVHQDTEPEPREMLPFFVRASSLTGIAGLRPEEVDTTGADGVTLTVPREDYALEIEPVPDVVRAGHTTTLEIRYSQAATGTEVQPAQAAAVLTVNVMGDLAPLSRDIIIPGDAIFATMVFTPQKEGEYTVELSAATFDSGEPGGQGYPADQPSPTLPASPLTLGSAALGLELTVLDEKGAVLNHYLKEEIHATATLRVKANNLLPDERVTVRLAPSIGRDDFRLSASTVTLTRSMPERMVGITVVDDEAPEPREAFILHAAGTSSVTLPGGHQDIAETSLSLVIARSDYQALSLDIQFEDTRMVRSRYRWWDRLPKTGTVKGDRFNLIAKLNAPAPVGVSIQARNKERGPGHRSFHCAEGNHSDTTLTVSVPAGQRIGQQEQTADFAPQEYCFGLDNNSARFISSEIGDQEYLVTEAVKPALLRHDYHITTPTVYSRNARVAAPVFVRDYLNLSVMSNYAASASVVIEMEIFFAEETEPMEEMLAYIAAGRRKGGAQMRLRLMRPGIYTVRVVGYYFSGHIGSRRSQLGIDPILQLQVGKRQLKLNTKITPTPNCDINISSIYPSIFPMACEGSHFTLQVSAPDLRGFFTEDEELVIAVNAWEQDGDDIPDLNLISPNFTGLQGTLRLTATTPSASVLVSVLPDSFVEDREEVIFQLSGQSLQHLPVTMRTQTLSFPIPRHGYAIESWSVNWQIPTDIFEWFHGFGELIVDTQLNAPVPADTTVHLRIYAVGANSVWGWGFNGMEIGAGKTTGRVTIVVRGHATYRLFLGGLSHLRSPFQFGDQRYLSVPQGDQEHFAEIWVPRFGVIGSISSWSPSNGRMRFQPDSVPRAQRMQDLRDGGLALGEGDTLAVQISTENLSSDKSSTTVHFSFEDVEGAGVLLTVNTINPGFGEEAAVRLTTVEEYSEDLRLMPEAMKSSSLGQVTYSMRQGRFQVNVLHDNLPEPREMIPLVLHGLSPNGAEIMAPAVILTIPRNDYAVSHFRVRASAGRPSDRFSLEAELNSEADSTVRITVLAFERDTDIVSRRALLEIGPGATIGSAVVTLPTAGTHTWSISTASFTHSLPGDQEELFINAPEVTVNVRPLLDLRDSQSRSATVLAVMSQVRELLLHFEEGWADGVAAGPAFCTEEVRNTPAVTGRLPCLDVDGNGVTYLRDVVLIQRYMDFLHLIAAGDVASSIIVSGTDLQGSPQEAVDGIIDNIQGLFPLQECRALGLCYHVAENQ